MRTGRLRRVGRRAIPGRVEPALRRRWWLVVATVVVVIVGGSVAVAAELGTDAAVLWAASATVTAGFVLAVFRYHLPRNHPPGEPEDRYRSVGLATGVTLARGGLLAVVAGFLLATPTGRFAWAPALCYGAASALDWIDGRIARGRDRTTVLGERLDMTLDTTGLVVASLVGVLWGRIPVWYLAVPAARYCYRGAVGLRERRGLPVDDLPESAVRRPIAGLQMAFVAVALAPAVPIDVVSLLAAVVIVPGLAVFVRDYLAVTRRFPDGRLP